MTTQFGPVYIDKMNTSLDSSTALGFYITLTVVTISVAYVSILALCRLFLSPIAVFPGPPLARLTYLTQWYYDWVKDGQYYLQIEEMHKKYGTISSTTLATYQITKYGCRTHCAGNSGWTAYKRFEFSQQALRDRSCEEIRFIPSIYSRHWIWR